VIKAITRHRGAASLALLHLDGTNGSTTFTDVYGSTWTAGGAAAISTTQAKFGQSLGLGGSNDYISTTNNIFQPAGGDFTWECFGYAMSVGGSKVLFSNQPPGGGNNGMICFLNAGQLTIVASNAGMTGSLVAQTAGATVTTGAWRHYAFVRHGNNFDAYLDGTSQFTVTAAGSIGGNVSGLAIGSASLSSSSSVWSGYIDEARVSNLARYTANFTPPSAPFTF
jgi:hypothetical protein